MAVSVIVSLIWSATMGVAFRTEAGVLSITSHPGGMIVFVDGAAVGVTPESLERPLLIALTPGRHQLRCTKPGYEDVSGAIVIRRGAALPVRAFPRPLWARCRVDRDTERLRLGRRTRGGLPNGFTTAARRFRIVEPPGTPLVVAYASPSFPIAVTLRRGDELLEGDVAAAKRAGSIEFVMPDGGPVEVEIAGRPESDEVRLGTIRYSLGLFAR